MSAKKLALELLINIQGGGLTLAELNEQLDIAKKQMKEMGDDGSDEFIALGHVVEKAEESMSDLNKEVGKSKKGFEETGKAQKDAAKGSGILNKGVKAVGTAFKAMGIGLVVAGLKFLFDALSSNQKVIDTFSKVTETISIVMGDVVSALVGAVEQVSKASNGFDGLKNVVVGLLTIAITPLKLSFFSIKLAIEQAQLGWEKSFFGGGDEAKIKELTAGIAETSLAIKETAVDAADAGKNIVENLGKAASEIGGVVAIATEGISKISVTAAIEQAKTNVELAKSAEIAAARQGLLVEKYDRQAEKQRQIRDEERNSITDRINANNELGLVLEKQQKAMLAQAALQVDNAQAQKNKNKNTETEVALINALANEAGVLAQVEGLRSENKVNDLGLNRELLQMNAALGQSESDLAYARALFDAEMIDNKVKSLEAIKELEENRMQDEMLRLEGIVELANAGTQAEIDAIIALDQFKEASRQANIKANADLINETSEQNKRINDNDKKLQTQRVELALSTLNALGGLVTAFAKGDEESQRKAFKLNKAFGIGQAIISTSVGVANALTAGGNPLKLATGAQFLEAGIVAATGAAQIATISKTQFNGGGSSTPPLSLSGNNAGNQPRGFANPSVDTGQQATKVIVTETDIRNVTRNVEGIYSRAVVVQ